MSGVRVAGRSADCCTALPQPRFRVEPEWLTVVSRPRIGLPSRRLRCTIDFIYSLSAGCGPAARHVMPRPAVTQMTVACILLAAAVSRVQAQNTTCQGKYLMADGTKDPSTHLDNWTVTQSGAAARSKLLLSRHCQPAGLTCWLDLAGTIYLPNTNLGDNDPLNLTSFKGTAGILTPGGQNYSTTASASDCATQCAASVGPQLLLGVDNATVQNITANKWFVACNMFIWCAALACSLPARTACLGMQPYCCTAGPIRA